jgi:hypothetical protein
MATYIPNLTDVFPEPSLYKPDIGFFDSMLKRKQAQYDEGVSKAMSAREMIRNAPLTDTSNIQLRDQYLKDADNALQSIASADLSLPQNVNAAMNIFAPFWEDNILMEDMMKTKINRASLADLEARKNSKDEKVRDTYSGIAVEYIMNDMEKLRNAGRNPDAYKKVEGRRSVPFMNVEKYLDEEAAKEPEKLKIVWDQPGGPALYHITNGQKAVKSFEQWAKSKMGNNFYEQFNVTGVVAREREEKQIRAANPNITDDQINGEIAKNVVGDLKGGFERNIKQLDDEIIRINNILDKIPNTFDAAQEQAYRQLIEEKNQRESEKENIRLKYQGFDQKSQENMIAQVMQNPNRYFATLAEQRTIENWSRGKAAVSSMEIKKNEPYLEAQRLQSDRVRLQIDATNAQTNQRKTEIDAINAETNRIKALKGDNSGSDNSDGGTNNSGGTSLPLEEGADTDTGGRYIGRGTTDITQNLPKAYDRFMSSQGNLFRGANELMYDPYSGVLNYAKNLNLDTKEIALVSTALKRYSNGQSNKLYKFDKNHEESKALDKLTTALQARPEISSAFPANSKDKDKVVSQMLMKYVETEFQKTAELLKNGENVPMTPQEKQVIVSYVNSKNMLDAYWANENNRKELVKNNLSKDPQLSKMLVDRNGEKDLVSLEDIKNQLDVKEIEVKSTTGLGKLSADDIALAYATGNIRAYKPRYSTGFTGGGGSSFETGYTIVKDDVEYDFVATMGQGINSKPQNFDKVANTIRNLNNQYGDSKEFKKNLEKANSAVVPDLLFYQNQSGKIGAVFSYNFNDKKENDPAYRIFNESLLAGNQLAMVYEDETGKEVPVPPSDRANMRNLLMNKEKNVEKYVSGYQFETIGADGNPTISFTLTPQSSEDESVAAFANKRVRIQVKPNAEGPTMSGLPNPASQFMFGKLLRGESVKSDPLMESTGFNYTVQPDNTEDPNYVIVEGSYMKRNIYDKLTGKLTNTMVKTPIQLKINLKGSNAQSPDVIINTLNSMFIDNLNANEKAQEEYERLSQQQLSAGTPATTSTIRTRADLGLPMK